MPRRGSSSPAASSHRTRSPKRAVLAVAERLGTDVVVFPSRHGGFHEQGEPEAFAATLRRVLTNKGADQDLWND
jgi:hypothetical protein